MSEIKIKLSEYITKERFEKIQNDLWEWFGDISKKNITIDKTI